MLHYGIIIHSDLPLRSRCTILDYKYGLQQVTLPINKTFHRIYHGMLVEYSFETHKKHRIATLNIIALPQSWVMHDLEFFHMVLRIITEHALERIPCQALYQLLTLLYRQHVASEDEHSERHNFFKLWFLCRLYLILEVYPEHHNSFGPVFIQLLSANVDYNLEICSETAKNLRTWLMSCHDTLIKT